MLHTYQLYHYGLLYVPLNFALLKNKHLVRTYWPILRMRYLMDLLMELGLDKNMLICNPAEENL